jgi:hypothetical protein
MAKTNSLNSHMGESNTSRADKMSGLGKKFMRDFYNGKSKKDIKKFSNRKRRNFLKNLNLDKI